MDQTHKMKIFLLGNSSVGKSSFIIKYIEDKFLPSNISTVGFNTFEKETKLPNGEKVKIIFIDTAGQEKYNSIAANLIRNAEGIIVMYDITKYETFESISKWIESIKEIKGNDFPSFPFILVGNKCDLGEEREV